MPGLAAGTDGDDTRLVLPSLALFYGFDLALRGVSIELIYCFLVIKA